MYFSWSWSVIINDGNSQVQRGVRFVMNFMRKWKTGSWPQFFRRAVWMTVVRTQGAYCVRVEKKLLVHHLVLPNAADIRSYEGKKRGKNQQKWSVEFDLNKPPLCRPHAQIFDIFYHHGMFLSTTLTKCVSTFSSLSHNWHKRHELSEKKTLFPPKKIPLPPSPCIIIDHYLGIHLVYTVVLQILLHSTSFMTFYMVVFFWPQNWPRFWPPRCPHGLPLGHHWVYPHVLWFKTFIPNSITSTHPIILTPLPNFCYFFSSQKKNPLSKKTPHAPHIHTTILLPQNDPPRI